MDLNEFYKRHLPHYQPPGATIFTTFRLAGSLPKSIQRQLVAEAKFMELKISTIPDEGFRQDAAQLAYKKIFGKWDHHLDAAKNGPSWLAQSEIAELIAIELKNNDGKLYTLDAFSIMPNHVHLVYTPLCHNDVYYSVAHIMHLIKGRTARSANLLLDRQGEFWQHESYDHVARNVNELERIIDYVVTNPIRAGLPGKWVYQRINTVG